MSSDNIKRIRKVFLMKVFEVSCRCEKCFEIRNMNEFYKWWVVYSGKLFYDFKLKMGINGKKIKRNCGGVG